jgi:cytochrome c oxidase subunit II
VDAFRLERRIIIVSVAFALTLFGLAALAINLYHVGLPTCLTDIKPFQKGELIAHSPADYELHYVARMWKFDPEEVTVTVGSAIDLYVSTPDVTHGVILLGTDLNRMIATDQMDESDGDSEKQRLSSSRSLNLTQPRLRQTYDH